MASRAGGGGRRAVRTADALRPSAFRACALGDGAGAGRASSGVQRAARRTRRASSRSSVRGGGRGASHDAASGQSGPGGHTGRSAAARKSSRGFAGAARAVELSLAAARRERGPARSPGFASAVFSVWTAECLPALPALPADSPGAGVDSNGPDSRQRVPKEDARPDGVGRNPVPGGARITRRLHSWLSADFGALDPRHSPRGHCSSRRYVSIHIPPGADGGLVPRNGAHPPSRFSDEPGLRARASTPLVSPRGEIDQTPDRRDSRAGL